MPRVNVSITDEFHEALKAYAKKRGLKSVSAALVELASVGHETVGGGTLTAMRDWGGDRRNPEYLEWLAAQVSDYDPSDDQDGNYSYAAWLAGRNSA